MSGKNMLPYIKDNKGMPQTICDNMSSEDTWMMPQIYFAY